MFIPTITLYPSMRAVAALMMLALPCVTFSAEEAVTPGGLSDEELSASSPASESDATSPASAGEPLDLTWDDLMPAGEAERLEALFEQYYESQVLGGPQSVFEGGPGDSMDQIGTFTTVGELDATLVRIPGFMVPLDFSQDRLLSRFLLVPYFGACIHSPPPPPNQIVFVTADPAVRLDSLWKPVTVEGVLRTQNAYTDTANAAYTLTLNNIGPYEY
ncbi:MAG: DUF3299 domain-containing protein [Pseudomonadota bacterium]